MEPQVDPISSRERKTLARLNRQARREHRRRAASSARLSRSGRPAAVNGFSADGAPQIRKHRPRLRRLLIHLAIASVAVLLLMIIFPPFLIPVDGTVTSRFFLRTNPESLFLFDVEHHRGIDFGAESGTPVRAARSGRIVAVTENPTYGLMIDIRHPLGLTTRYAHLSETRVREGQWIWRRVRIGRVGMTGRATGPHLHFEIRAGDRSLPPGWFLVFSTIRRFVLAKR